MDREWVLEVLGRFAVYRYMEGLNAYDALQSVINDDEDGVVEPMIARSSTFGEIAGVEEGDVFVYRAELYLVGLHDDLVRGISLGRIPNSVEAATCLVAVFLLHNYFPLDDDDQFFIYGGEGGYLADANQVNVRVLANQHWSRRNVALRNSIDEFTPVRLILADVMADNSRTYTFVGLFEVRAWQLVFSNGFQVIEFLLRRF